MPDFRPEVAPYVALVRHINRVAHRIDEGFLEVLAPAVEADVRHALIAWRLLDVADRPWNWNEQ